MQTMTRTQSKIMWKEKHTKNDGGEAKKRTRKGKRDEHEEWTHPGSDWREFLSFPLFVWKRKLVFRVSRIGSRVT